MSLLNSPRLLLHLEGFVLFSGALAAYAYLQGNAWLFIALLLAPDLAMLGYLINPLWGSRLYNLAHHVALPVLLVALGLMSETRPLILVGLIWLAHIGMDRTVGYGLKYQTAFKDTHLQRV